MSAQKLLNFFEELLHSPEKGENIEEITSKSLALFTDQNSRSF